MVDPESCFGGRKCHRPETSTAELYIPNKIKNAAVLKAVNVATPNGG